MAPVGLVALREGIAMSEVRSFTVTASGAGGHGATAGVEGNVLLAIATLAGELGSVVEGMSHETTACVCSAGVLRAGTAPNVVPSTAELRGTLRTFTADHRDAALAALRQRCDALAARFGCDVELVLSDHAPAVVNDAAATAVVRREAAGVLGAARVLTIPPVTPSDDVSEFLDRVGGCYFFVGAARPDGTSGPHHSPAFRLDEGCLPVAARVLARSAVALAAPEGQASGP
jgi:amidohydrolase